MVRTIDRVLTTVSAMVGSTAAIGFLIAGLLTWSWFLLEFDARTGPRNDRKQSPTTRYVSIQGVSVDIPGNTVGVTCDVLTADGTVRPNCTYVVGERKIYDGDREVDSLELNSLLPADVRLYGLFWRNRDGDYRFPWNRVDRLESDPSWIFSPNHGLMKLGDGQTLEGSLTDEGWVAGRRARSTFNDATRVFPELPGKPVFYITPDGLYRADLEQRTMTRLASLSGPRGMTSLREGGLLRSHVVVTREQVYVADIASAGRLDVLTVPESIRALGLVQFDAASDGQLIFRAELPGTRTDRSLRYRVAALRVPSGVVNESEYEFRPSVGTIAPEEESEAGPRPVTTGDLFGTMPGRLAAALIPPAGWSLPPLAPDFPDSDYRKFIESVRAHGSPWPGTLVAAVLAVLVARRMRPLFGGLAGPVLCGMLVLALGVAGVLVLWVVGSRHRFENCRACGRRYPGRFTHCPRCRSAAPAPEPLGIEILHPAD